MRYRRIMSRLEQFTAVIGREGDGFVALCPELDIASQGDTVEEARDNLSEAVQLFFEGASTEEVARRLQTDVYVSRMQVPIG